MLKRTQKDERTLAIERQINSNAFTIMIALAILALFLKVLLYREAAVYTDSMLYIDGAVLVIPVAYTFFASIRKGHDGFSYNNAYLLIGLGVGILAAAAVVLLSSHPDRAFIARRAVLAFVLGTLITNLLYFLMGKHSKAAAQKRADALLEDED